MSQAPSYSILDSGNCRKLEQAGAYRLIRPALNAFWKPSQRDSEWNGADAIFERNSTGGGVWTWKNGPAPAEWNVSWGGINLLAKPTNFGHLGFFPEQAPNWKWLRESISKMPKGASTLNLFAYSGGATISMAQAGAEVCHLDASKGIIDWAKRNQDLNRGSERIRWICDDAMKFVSREVRRGRKYNGIVLDPPSFGRGAQGQVWKIEDGIGELLQSCRELLDLSNPHFILLSCHSQGISCLSLARCLAETFKESARSVEGGEMIVPERSGNLLPAGIYARLLSV